MVGSAAALEAARLPTMKPSAWPDRRARREAARDAEAGRLTAAYRRIRGLEEEVAVLQQRLAADAERHRLAAQQAVRMARAPKPLGTPDTEGSGPPHLDGSGTLQGELAERLALAVPSVEQVLAEAAAPPDHSVARPGQLVRSRRNTGLHCGRRRAASIARAGQRELNSIQRGRRRGGAKPRRRAIQPERCGRVGPQLQRGDAAMVAQEGNEIRALQAALEASKEECRGLHLAGEAVRAAAALASVAPDAGETGGLDPAAPRAGVCTEVEIQKVQDGVEVVTRAECVQPTRITAKTPGSIPIAATARPSSVRRQGRRHMAREPRRCGLRCGRRPKPGGPLGRAARGGTAGRRGPAGGPVSTLRIGLGVRCQSSRGHGSFRDPVGGQRQLHAAAAAAAAAARAGGWSLQTSQGGRRSARRQSRSRPVAVKGLASRGSAQLRTRHWNLERQSRRGAPIGHLPTVPAWVRLSGSSQSARSSTRWPASSTSAASRVGRRWQCWWKMWCRGRPRCRPTRRLGS